MASFVEQATLRIVDQSTRQIKTVNSALQQLFRTARQGRNIQIRLNLGQAQSQVRALTRDLERLRAIQGRGTGRQVIAAPTGAQLRRINDAASAMQRYATAARRAASVTFPMPPVARGFGAGAMAGGAAAGAVRGGRLSPLSTTPFPGNIPTAFNIGTAYLTVRAVHMLGRAAATATFEAQSERTTRQLTIQSVEDRQTIQDIARSIVQAADNITSTRAQEITRDLFVVGFRDEMLSGIAPHIARLEAAALGVAPERAESIATLANKLGNLAAVTENATRAQELATGVYRAAIVQGETFNAPTLIAALRVAGFAQTISEEGLVNFAGAVDELGRVAGSGLQRLSQVLTTRLDQAGAGGGVAKGTVERLIAAGIRTETGVVQPELFTADPSRWVREVVGGLLRERGLDATDTEQRSQVREALQEMGFQTNALRLVLNELSAAPEREKALALSAAFQPENIVEAAANDLGFQLDNLAKQFASFSASALTPLFDAAAPAAKGLADLLKMLSLAEGTSGHIQRLGFAASAAAIAFAAFKGANSLVQSLFNPLNASATALNSSAVALTRAAVALGGAGVAGQIPGPRRAPGAVPSVGAGRGANTVGSSNFGRAGVGLSGLLGAVQITAATATMEVDRLSDDPAQRQGQLVDAQRRLQETEAAWNSWAEGLPLIGSLWQKVEEGRTALDSFNAFLQREWPTDGTTRRSMLADLPPITADEVGGLREELQRLTKGIEARERAQEAGKLGPTGMDQLEVQRAQVELITAQLAQFDQSQEQFETALVTGATNFNANADRFNEVFGTGADRLNTVGPTIDAAALQFGPTAGQGLLAIAPEVGNAIGAAAAAQLNSARVNLTLPQQPTPADTGAFIPD